MVLAQEYHGVCGQILICPKNIGLFAFNDKSYNAGDLAYELGSVAATTKIHTSNASPFFITIRENLEEPLFTIMMRKTGIINAQKQIKNALSYLPKARIESKEENLIKEEFKNAARLCEHARRKGLLMIEKYETGSVFPKNTLKSLIKDSEEIINKHKKLWLKRNRPGGLEKSVEMLERVMVNTYKKYLE